MFVYRNSNAVLHDRVNGDNNDKKTHTLGSGTWKLGGGQWQGPRILAVQTDSCILYSLDHITQILTHIITLVALTRDGWLAWLSTWLSLSYTMKFAEIQAYFKIYFLTLSDNYGDIIKYICLMVASKVSNILFHFGDYSTPNFSVSDQSGSMTVIWLECLYLFECKMRKNWLMSIISVGLLPIPASSTHFIFTCHIYNIAFIIFSPPYWHLQHKHS